MRGRLLNNMPRLAGRLRADRRGVAAIEFAVFAQVFALIFAGVADLGLVLYDRFRLNNALSAATNLAVVNPTAVSSARGAALAQALGDVVVNAIGTNFSDTAIVVNNGPSRTVTAGAATTGGTAAGADRCYCPSVTATVAWGAPLACGAPCDGGLRAGKFVSLTASRPHRPLFANYGIVEDGAIRVTTLVQTE